MNPPPDQPPIYLAFNRGEVSDIMEDLPLGQSASEATRNFYLKLREIQRNPPQGGPVPDIPVSDVEFAPILPVRPVPARLPRRGLVVRKHDVTGISGLGVIVEFCVFSDGAVSYRWLGGPPQDQPKFEFYDKPGIAPFVQISGHGGNTEIVWIDEEEPSAEVPLGQ